MILCLSIFLAFIVISVVAICLFKYKEGSSLGRMLVWKISLMHIKEWFVTGVGFGGFEYNYNKWQAEYFINNPDDITNARLADYIQFAYNEFLQNFIECGIIGFLLFVFIIGLIFRNIIIKVKNSNKIIALFTIPFSVSFFAITIMFLTSYPLQNLYLLLIFFTITAMLSHGMPNIIKIYRSQTLSFVIMIVAIFFSFSQLKYIKPLTKWHKANVLYYDEDYLQSVAIYSEIFDSMNKDPLFLQFYAKSLQMAREYQKSTSVLNVSNKRRTDQQAYICLAVDYIAMQMYDEAESNLLYASHLIPNKLYPIYLLAKTFYDAGDMEKAKKYAIVGINFPVKIQSAAINEMQNELQNILINVQEKIQ
jgi:tetratricopeptide (TPR) repeat protein